MHVDSLLAVLLLHLVLGYKMLYIILGFLCIVLLLSLFLSVDFVYKQRKKKPKNLIVLTMDNRSTINCIILLSFCINQTDFVSAHFLQCIFN